MNRTSFLARYFYAHRKEDFMYIRRFTYKPEDVDCKLCTEYKKCDRNLMKCPWIAERIEAGAVSYKEAVLTAFPGTGHTQTM